jgi:uncharacterized membrane protein YtjA (UPF0391 family)
VVLLQPGPFEAIGVGIVLGWALIFFLLALICGVLGFFALAGLAGAIAKILLLVFLILLLVNAFSDVLRRRPSI